MLKRLLDGKTVGGLFVLLLLLCVSAVAQGRSDEWTLTPSDYRYDMSLYLSMASKDYENPDLYEVGAFVGDECRGLAETLELPNGSSCLYMRVRSNSAAGETLSLKLRDKSTGTIYVLKGSEGRTIDFKADEMVGTPSAPFVLYVYYNVSVGTDGHGTVSFENGEYAEGSVLNLSAQPNEGYHFDKWSDGNPDANRALTVSGDIDLTAQFAPNIYTAVFKIDGEVIASLEIPYGESVTAPDAPAKDGYIFAGWNDIPVTMPAHDVEIIGSYIPSLYNVIFTIDGELIAALNLEYGAVIVPPVAPEKIGYTFNGWDNLPETMPAGNLEITGSYTVNKYKVTFNIGEEKIHEADIDYGAPIAAPEAPAKEGYTFGGWQNVPETMPAHDLDIYGEYQPTTYNAVFKIDGEVVATEQVQYGMTIPVPEAPVKEGHTFAGWQNVPETMPAGDIEISGTYTINTYKATFVISGETVAEIDVVYNTAVNAPEAPAKEGYTFTGWQNVPETMPPFDITIEGNYAVNTYNIVYMVDGEVVATVPVEYGATITPVETPVKEGYTFAGWQNVPETMPAGDITVNGSYTINTYTARFVVDGEVVAEQAVEYGASVVAPETPVKEGYTFTGWQNIPETMPASDVDILGTFDVLAFNVTFMIDGEVVAYLPVDFGAPIPVAEAPVKEGHTFAGWQNVPETMPAHDLEINGSYTINSYKATFVIDGETVAELTLEYNTPVVGPEVPAKEGHTFAGWQNIPATMPPFDITIEGAYSVNTYNAVFMIDGEVVATEPTEFGKAIAVPEAPVKEGHTFTGWQNVPETMPAQDIEINGSYAVDTYKATFVIDGVTVAELNVEYNTAVTAPEAPAKEGHTFTGWQNVPETMPPFDITIEGTYAVNTYNVVFTIDGYVVATIPTEFGKAITAPEAPAKEGHTFTGWQNVPETMPAQDLEINGSYTVDSYKAIFVIDGETVAELNVEYNTAINAPEAPVKEGHTFTGWQNIPETMPPFDITIEGTYAVNTYNVVFKIDGEVVATVPTEFGKAITAPEAPVKEGHTFTGWNNVPETMPAQDIEINGSYTADTYKAIFVIDGETVAELNVEYNTAITAPEAPAKEGYTFTGWQNIPETMPPFDITIEGTYAVNTYNVVFKIDGEVVATVPTEFGKAITAPEAPVKEGHTFTGWQNLPETMPAQDIEINGSYDVATYKATFIADGVVVAEIDVPYNTAVTAPEAPAKEGYTFTGWQNVPETMPSFDVEIYGTYSVNAYTVTFQVGDDVIATLSVEYGASIALPEAPGREGFVFDGWQNVPETMPAQNIVIYGSYSEDPNAAPVINSYIATFKVDGEVIAMMPIEEGAPVVAPEVPAKEGHTFAGWQNLPETMPSHDIEVNGSFNVNTYKAIFKIDGEEIATIDVAYNNAVAAPEAPAKEGYSFIGWQNVPETMPPFDIEIYGSYAVNTYSATFKVDDEVMAEMPYDFGAPVVAPDAPVKEGHTFTGWENVPETMPAENITINGSYTVNVYKATFIIDGEVIAEADVEYNTAVTAPEAPAKEGYTFTGWQNVPETMPPFDVQIIGTYSVNAYTLTFKIGDEVVAEMPYDFGAAVTAPEAPAKEGHTFTGWENVPETMPAENVVVNGSYTVNVYKATFMIDGEVIAEADVEYNTAVTAPEAPAKEGYVFTGWQNVPETMPPFDVQIVGAYAVNPYTVTFKIGDDVVTELVFDYGAPVVAPDAPVKEGHTFTGWENVPETMPAENIVVSGSYTVNVYKATFIIDGEVIAETDVEYNTAVTAPEAPAKEGYTFTGWQNVPETMPPFDVQILGTYSVNAYTLTFKIDDEVVVEVPYDFGATVTAPEAPFKEGYTFNGWQNVPETMPAENVVVTGSYTVNVYKAYYVIDDVVIAEAEVEYGAPVAVPSAPAKEGYTFTGWQNVPETMPAADVQIVGVYTINAYTATFKVGDEVVAAAQFDFGAPVVAPEAPVKEGHTFDGWQNVPETMPAADIDIIGSYTVNIYKATFVVDGEVIAETNVEYNATVPVPEAPVKEGYVFSGWQNVPATMPPFDIEIMGTFAVNPYTATFKIGDEIVAELIFDFGAPVVAPEAPAKEGYTFMGWQGVPETMPSENIVIEGSYAVNFYKATFIIDGEVIAETNVEYNTPVTAPEAPAKEGHTFTGWQNVPETMPPFDVEILGTYAVDTYVVTFKIGDEVVAEVPFDFGAQIVAPEAPAKEGHTFTGWEDVPSTMPAENIVVNGSYTINSYTVRYHVDGEVIAEVSVEYGAAIPEYVAPEREGQSFGGWDNVPATMPASDIDIYGSYVLNSYMATFKIGELFVAALRFNYGAFIQAPDAPEKEGHTFTGWQNLPETMPAQDIEIQGAYDVNMYMLRLYLNNELYKSEEVAYGTTLVIPDPEVPEGKEFAGWTTEIPETMPAHDVDIYGEVKDATVFLGSICADGNQMITVYTISGILLYKDITAAEAQKQLKPGFYIINGEKVRVP